MIMGVENSTQEGSMGAGTGGKTSNWWKGESLGTAPMVKRAKEGMMSKETIL